MIYENFIFMEVNFICVSCVVGNFGCVYVLGVLIVFFVDNFLVFELLIFIRNFDWDVFWIVDFNVNNRVEDVNLDFGGCFVFISVFDIVIVE